MGETISADLVMSRKQNTSCYIYEWWILYLKNRYNRERRRLGKDSRKGVAYVVSLTWGTHSGIIMSDVAHWDPSLDLPHLPDPSSQSRPAP